MQLKSKYKETSQLLPLAFLFAQWADDFHTTDRHYWL